MNVSATQADWNGAIAFAPMMSVYCGTGGVTPVHSTVAHKIVIGTRQLLCSGKVLDPSEPNAIPAGADHQFDGRSRSIILGYLDTRHFTWEDARNLAERWARLDPESVSIDCLQEDMHKLDPRPLHNRLLRAVSAIELQPSISQAANSIGLSEGRFTHLISDKLGAPPRSWQRWLKLRRAIDMVAFGSNVTEAAHEAGFADSAHFSRTCHNDIGMRPSVLKSGQIRFQRSNESCELSMA